MGDDLEIALTERGRKILMLGTLCPYSVMIGVSLANYWLAVTPRDYQLSLFSWIALIVFNRRGWHREQWLHNLDLLWVLGAWMGVTWWQLALGGWFLQQVWGRLQQLRDRSDRAFMHQQQEMVGLITTHSLLCGIYLPTIFGRWVLGDHLSPTTIGRLIVVYAGLVFLAAQHHQNKKPSSSYELVRWSLTWLVTHEKYFGWWQHHSTRILDVVMLLSWSLTLT